MNALTVALEALVAGRDLDREQCADAVREIMSGDAEDAQIGAFLVALRMKGETTEEIVGAASTMRALSQRVHVDAPNLVDTCGTGGSATKVFNVSTAAAFVTAAAGAQVAKHGNRAMTSKSGSADLLEAAGVDLDLTPEQVGRCIEEVGVGFLFAQRHHAAMRHVAGPRRALGVRTLFNVLGPLTNPAGAPAQVIGVFDDAYAERLAEALAALGSRHVMIVHGADGLDEITLACETRVVELKDGRLSRYEIRPEDFGIASSPLDPLRADSAEESLALVRAALRGEGPASDIVALNAGAAIHVAGLARDLEAGVRMAQDAIDSGLARARLAELVRISSLMNEA